MPNPAVSVAPTTPSLVLSRIFTFGLHPHLRLCVSNYSGRCPFVSGVLHAFAFPERVRPASSAGRGTRGLTHPARVVEERHRWRGGGGNDIKTGQTCLSEPVLASASSADKSRRGRRLRPLSITLSVSVSHCRHFGRLRWMQIWR